MKFACSFVLQFTFAAMWTVAGARCMCAQSGTSSALAGAVTDVSGAVIQDATVTAINIDIKATRTGQTSSAGRFLFAQVNPGTYQVTVEAPGFGRQSSPPIPVEVGRTETLNFSLQVFSKTQNVEVKAEQGLLSLDNPNTTITLDEKVIKSLPNPGAPTCPLAVSLNTFPSGTLKVPYYYQYNAGVEREVGLHGAIRVDYVGTRGVHEPYQVQLNGYQNVCQGCFAPYSFGQPLDQRFGSVDEFRTDANSAYAGLQTSFAGQFAGLTLRGNYTFSHCLDEISNGGLLPFSTQGIISPLPGALGRQYGDCDYDVRHNVSAFGLYEMPFHSHHSALRQVFGGWSVSETAILHSGLPFTALSQPYTANNHGIFQASGPQYAARIPGVPLYSKTPYPGVTIVGTKQWLNPNAFRSVVDPATGACSGGDSVANCQFGNAGRNTVRGPHFTDSDFYITRRVPLREGVSLRLDGQFFNGFNHPNFALPSSVQAGIPGGSIPAKFGTLQSTISPPTGLLGVGLGGDSSPRMIAFQARIEF